MYDSKVLNNIDKIIKNEDEPIQILIYDFVYPKNKFYEIKVLFNNISKIFILKHTECVKDKKLALTTLFKNDYKLIKIFYDYYKNQGVEHFFMYYNGKIDDEVKSYFNYEDITLIEWDFKYRHCNSVPSGHYAQLGQIHDAIYRFGKDKYEYMLFCDLDEYFYLPNNGKLIDLVSDENVDTFVFHNCWANTEDNTIPDVFPDKFLIAHKPNITPNINILPHRAKCIHKMDSIVYTNIHIGKKFNKKSNVKNESIMFHFYSWSKPERKINTYGLFNMHSNY